MYPGKHAKAAPEKPAVIMASTGDVVTYGELDEGSNRLAHVFRSSGLKQGDHVAFLMENHPRFLEVAWGAQRSGLYYTPINWHLGDDEIAYILEDSGARIFVTTSHFSDVAESLARRVPNLQRWLMLDGATPSYEDYDEVLSEQSPSPLDDECEGLYMLYTSGTTGRPKGVKRPLSGGPMGSEDALAKLMREQYSFSEDTMYLSPAPLYHGAPIGWSLTTQRLGGTVVVMERFDAAGALAAIDRYRVTHGQFVPTMFVRMLRLPDAERERYDLSSLQVAVHDAAPCPVPVKHQMIDWWGPIFYEYYAGSEGNGFTSITTEEWLSHEGSVGRGLTATVHILDDDGNELPPHEPGTVYFEGGRPFEYHNDPEKTKSVFNDRGWSTIGDVGYLDEEGYLYLTDRKAYTIISGGVNIYPQEAEDVLLAHPKVMDAAVFGIPNEEFGEEVKAVVQPVDQQAASTALAEELLAYCRERLAHYKCPRSLDFEAELPRTPTGKLRKRDLRERYWQNRGDSRIV